MNKKYNRVEEIIHPGSVGYRAAYVRQWIAYYLFYRPVSRLTPTRWIFLGLETRRCRFAAWAFSGDAFSFAQGPGGSLMVSRKQLKDDVQ